MLPIMLAGALPFAVIYRAVRKDVRNLLSDIQVRTFVTIIVIGTVLLVIENYYFYHDIFTSARYSIFQFISAVTSTGFQTADVTQWSKSALLIMSIGMIIGGCAGSTAGGIKVARAYFLGSEVKLWLMKSLQSKNSIVAVKIGDKRVTEEVINKELAEATLISFLWIVSVLVSVLLLSHVVSSSFDLSHIIFAVCSAQGNVGITCGIINPDMSYIGKIIIIVDMWIGRLEIIPVLMLVRYLFKGFSR